MSTHCNETSIIDSLEKLAVKSIVSVPDSYITNLLKTAQDDGRLKVILAGREEECIGISSGYALGGVRSLCILQNVGFLNAMGCFGTLAVNYGIPLVILIINRGSLHDANVFDPPKYQSFQSMRSSLGVSVFDTTWSQLGASLELAFKRSEAAGAPTLLAIDHPNADFSA